MQNNMINKTKRTLWLIGFFLSVVYTAFLLYVALKNPSFINAIIWIPGIFVSMAFLYFATEVPDDAQ